MKHQHSISKYHWSRWVLGVSALALAAVSVPARAQEQPRPSLKVLVYNIWNKFDASAFWVEETKLKEKVSTLAEGTEAAKAARFTPEMVRFLQEVNADVIVYPELNNNHFVHKDFLYRNRVWVDALVRETQEAMKAVDGSRPFGRSQDVGGYGNGIVLSRVDFADVSMRRVLLSPDNGLPEIIFTGIHLSHADDPLKERLGQARALNSFVAAQARPAIAAGDFNAANVSERGLLSAYRQFESWARHVANNSATTSSVLSQYVQNPENITLLNQELAYWRALNDKGVVRHKTVVSNWDNRTWDEILKPLTKAMLERNPALELIFADETYPIAANIPVTMNLLKQQHQVLQLERNREIFEPSVRFDGRSTWTSDGRENENIWHWWDRAVIDHILSARPFAKWTVVDVNDPNAGILNGRTTDSKGVDPSDHEPIAQNILWYVPKLTASADGKTTDLSFSKEAPIYNASGEFILSRNNHRTDVRFDNISDSNGLPIYRDDVNAVGKLGRKLLNDQVADLISRGLLTPQNGLDYANDPNAALKMDIPCGNKDVLQTIAGATELCVDSHEKFMALNIKDGVVAFDEVAALGNDTGVVTLDNGGLRSAGPNDAWARWTSTPSGAIEKPIVIEKGIGSFEVSDPASEIAVNGPISGEGSFEKRGEGTLTLNGENSYEGATIVHGGVLRAGSSTAFGVSGQFDISGGRLELGGNDLLINELRSTSGTIDIGKGNLALNFSDDTQLSTSFEGEGWIVKAMHNNLNLTGNSAHRGFFIVGEGSLTVGDAANVNASTDSHVVLLPATSISGVGQIGALSAAGGSAIRPGNSIGTLRIARDLNVDVGAAFDVEIASNGTSDQLLVGGKASLKGGLVNVTTVDPQQSYRSRQLYRILDAEGGVEGRFEQASTQSAFLDLGLVYSANAVDLDITVKADFAETALTENERNTAQSLSSLDQAGASLELYNSLLPLSAEQSREAYNALSGEIHASLKGSLLEDSRFARQAANKRLLEAGKGEGVTFWTDAYGEWGRTEGDGNAAKLDRDAGGLFFGGDATIADTWQLGIFGGYGASTYEAKARASKADVDSYTLGAYAGTWFDPVALRVGLANSWHSIDVARAVNYATFGENLSSSYDAQTLQVFGEVSSKVEVGTGKIEPFAGLAYVKLDTDSYAEQGVAGLYGAGDKDDATFSTLGLRFGKDLVLGETKGALKGSIAWQHAFGSTTPYVQQQFASGRSFNVGGVPIAKDAALLELGYDWSISDSATLGFAYQGYIGSGVQNHGGSAKLQVRF